jgi:glycosyltransferase involved in cell wall biosynthesis
VVTASAFSAREIGRYLGIPASRIVVVPAGITRPDHEIAEPKAPVVLFVGSLFNRRRVPEMIRGFALTAARVPSARLVLVGDNRTRPVIDPIALASDLDIADRVEWTRYVPDAELARLYQTASVFTFLSDYEGFAMTPMEAMAHGAVPILLDTEVAREVYADAARFVTAAPEDIARAMVTLLTDPPARAALLDAGRARLAQFSWPRAAAAVRGVIERAAKA